MNRIKTIILAFSLLTFTQIVNAQEDYDFYLQKARQRLAEGDCSRAETCYNTYKDIANKTNREIEQLIEECKKGVPSDYSSDLTFTVNGELFTMKYVEGGSFWMGAQSVNPGGQNYDSEADVTEGPVHRVTVNSFYMGETEVNNALWKAVMGTTPGSYSAPALPANGVSWEECQDFIQKLNELTGKSFRVPTEAEWEYAARGGNKNNGYKYAGGNSINNIAWYNISMPYITGFKSSNELGLYDMSGNLLEWCQDWYGRYSSGKQINPQGPSNALYHPLLNVPMRVMRGGYFCGGAELCRVSWRGDSASFGINEDFLGLRLALTK